MKEVGKEAGKEIRAIRAMGARRIGTVGKTLLNISLSMINRNSISCQTLQYIKYHLVEPVRSFKWATGWSQGSNL